MLLSRQRDYPRKKPLPGIPGNAFAAEGDTIRATVQPMGGTATPQMYGLNPSQMRLLLAGPECDIREDDGLCVDVGADADPDFRVLYVERWPRSMRAHLKHIPEGERGADG